ncbi:hypothetical protein NDU88_001707 [Pleurodeles waltl]|uniref:Uncharacterized protein n=1 Tax=Pleurodeles waltl TaxID=8319 RepID=A0AAV7VX67_PLEWA|nr:hypothetical protein NDU88_001707 [Pleurodeles waltl]
MPVCRRHISRVERWRLSPPGIEQTEGRISSLGRAEEVTPAYHGRNRGRPNEQHLDRGGGHGGCQRQEEIVDDCPISKRTEGAGTGESPTKGKTDL